MFGTSMILNREKYNELLEEIESEFNRILHTHIPDQETRDFYQTHAQQERSICRYAFTLRTLACTLFNSDENLHLGIDIAKYLARFNKHESAGALADLALYVISRNRPSQNHIDTAQQLMDLSHQHLPIKNLRYDSRVRVLEIIWDHANRYGPSHS